MECILPLLTLSLVQSRACARLLTAPEVRRHSRALSLCRQVAVCHRLRKMHKDCNKDGVSTTCALKITNSDTNILERFIPRNI